MTSATNSALGRGSWIAPREMLHFFGVETFAIQQALAAAMECGADYADLYFQHQQDTSVGLEDSIISRAHSSVSRGVGIRAVAGDQVGYAYSESLARADMLLAAKAAAAIAAGAGSPPPQDLTPRGLTSRYAPHQAWEQVTIEQRLAILRRVEATARKLETSVEKVRASLSDSDERVLIASSEGNLTADHRPMLSLHCSTTCRKGEARQSGSASITRRDSADWLTDERIDRLSKDAVERTLILFEARRPPAGQMPVILAAGASGILLHEAIGHGLEADFNRKGTSIYSNQLGQKVAPDFVTVVDDGTLPHDRGALNIDDEGNPSQRTVLIENGVLRGYLHDRISARHYGAQLTGSGRRQSFRHAPLPRMRSTYMLDGPHSLEEMIASVDRGILAEHFANGQVQIGAGDFTFYVRSGYLIEGGKITAPIKDVNIIGNGPQVLRDVKMAGSDGRIDNTSWVCGKDGQSVPVSLGIPSVLVGSLTVGGVNG